MDIAQIPIVDFLKYCKQEGDLKNVRTLITYIKNRMLDEKEIEA